MSVIHFFEKSDKIRHQVQTSGVVLIIGEIQSQLLVIPSLPYALHFYVLVDVWPIIILQSNS